MVVISNALILHTSLNAARMSHIISYSNCFYHIKSINNAEYNLKLYL